MSLITDAKRKIARKYLEELLEKKDKEIYRDLAVAANAIAKRMMMDWFDSQRINHCKECPSNKQLFKYANEYYCEQHRFKIAADSQKPLELVTP